jgi:hypothetical protein
VPWATRRRGTPPGCEANTAEDRGGSWSTPFEAGDVSVRLAVLRSLVCSAAEKDPVALQLLVELLPSIDRLLADVQAAFG